MRLFCFTDEYKQKDSAGEMGDSLLGCGFEITHNRNMLTFLFFIAILLISQGN
ncbi:hypothetical protein HMPREF9413_1785 [Paenibacillus sp. HGF7]|nr:hypothetical protein HMPREF9413_1785 [Paenibacillus sp. HGF7]